MLGSALRKIWVNSGNMICLPLHKHYDLTSPFDVNEMFYKYYPGSINGPEGIDVVVHLAAKVGGVKGNSENPADFFDQNLMMNTNVLRIAKAYNVPKVVSMLSTCVYPDKVDYPIDETYLHNGEPHFTNYGYAYAKRMLEVQSRTYREQHGLDYVCLIPTNLYGPNDNFDLDGGHFVAAVIRKICDAKREGRPSVTFWGDGSPLRQFTFTADIAEVIDWVVKNYDEGTPLNVGQDAEVSIAYVVNTVKKIVEYDGEIVWDTTKPIGQYKKTVSIKRLRDAGYNKEFTPIEKGLRVTCDWYRANYPNVRGINNET